MPAIVDDILWQDRPDISDEEASGETTIRPAKKKVKKAPSGNRVSLAAFLQNNNNTSSALSAASNFPAESSVSDLFSNDLYYPGLNERPLASPRETALFSDVILEDDKVAVADSGSRPLPDLSEKFPEKFPEKLSKIERNISIISRSNFSPPPHSERIFVWRRPPSSNHAHIPVTIRGTEFYLKLKAKNWRNEVSNNFASKNVVTMTSADSFHTFRTLQDKIRAEMAVDSVVPVNTVNTVGVAEMTSQFQEMWVEKYRPEKYIDLLSDEGVNRALLYWLKLWDVPVFKKEPSFMNPYKDFGSKRKNRNTDQQLTYDRRKYGGVSDFCFTVEGDKRPRFKAALLCGPPGLGKTTLAQVIARHAGYEPLEINASDDRALEVFRTRVEASVMNGNVGTLLLQGEDRSDKPKCLIIDEIDGAPPNTVEYLVRLLKGEAKTVGNKKKSKQLDLWRPIICICNDLYVPALKSLRKNTMVLRFPPINRERLSARLAEICRVMSVKADFSVLYTLCEKSDDDIRTCLNSLQFCSVQGRRLNIADVTKAAMGCKDQRKQLLKVWEEIFQLPRSKGSDPRTGPLQKKDGTTAGADRMGRILEVVQLGEMEKIVNGVFENYLRIHHKDASLETAHRCAEWRAFSDVIERSIFEDQNWFLLGYLSFYPVAVHFFLAATSSPLFLFPVSQFETQKKQKDNQERITCFLKELSPFLFQKTKSQNLPMEMISFLTHILQPPLKNVSLHLLSNTERLELKQVIDLMIAYGLSYHDERSLTGVHTEVLEPRLESISSFPDVQQCIPMPAAVRAMVSREVQLRRINVGARAESNREGTDTQTDMDTDTADVIQTPSKRMQNPLASKSQTNTSTTSTTSNTSNTGKLQVWSVYDYFRKPLPSDGLKSVGTSQTRKIFFRHKEGFSNAVCRNVKVKDLM